MYAFRRGVPYNNTPLELKRAEPFDSKSHATAVEIQFIWW